MHKRAYLSTLLVVLLAVFGWGCSCGGTDDNQPTASSGSGGGASGSGTNVTGAGGSGGCLIDCTTGNTTGTGQQGVIIIAPDDPELLVVNGAIPTQAFTATLDGADVTANVTWLYERPDIGDIAAGSTFTPTGVVGGIGKLTAEWNNAAGETPSR